MYLLWTTLILGNPSSFAECTPRAPIRKSLMNFYTAQLANYRLRDAFHFLFGPLLNNIRSLNRSIKTSAVGSRSQNSVHQMEFPLDIFIHGSNLGDDTRQMKDQHYQKTASVPLYRLRDTEEACCRVPLPHPLLPLWHEPFNPGFFHTKQYFHQTAQSALVVCTDVTINLLLPANRGLSRGNQIQTPGSNLESPAC